MSIVIIKSEITNSFTDSNDIDWAVCESEESADFWISEKKAEIEKWNESASMYQSTRYVYCEKYSEQDILEMPMNELEGMRLRHFLQLLTELKDKMP